MEQESTQSECPLLRMLGEDVTVAWDIIQHVVNRRQKIIDTLMSQIDNWIDIDPEISWTVMELLDMYSSLSRHELEAIDWEIQLSIQNWESYQKEKEQRERYKKALQATRLILENIIKRTLNNDLIPDDE